jgi:hypothetical protein
VARDAPLATHGGLSLERCAVSYQIAPMALSRLVCALGQHRLVRVLTRWGLSRPTDFRAEAPHSHGLTATVSLLTLVSGRVIWPLGDTEDASAAALTPSYQAFPRVAVPHEPASRVRGLRTEGFDSTTKSLHPRFPSARLGTCLRHALTQLPSKLTARASPMRQARRAPFHPVRSRARQRKRVRVLALSQRLCHCADHVTQTAGIANGARVRRWCQEPKAGWSALLADPQMPVTRTPLDPAHNAIDRT